VWYNDRIGMPGASRGEVDMRKRTATAAAAGLIAAATALPSWAPAAAAGDPQRGGTTPAAIVFTRSRPSSIELYTMGMHGGNQRRLTQDTAEDSTPEWSPDGTRLAWSRTTESLVSDIWVMNADGTDRRNLTHADGSFDPTWSPDGTRIAYERNFTIWVIDADGTDDHQISPAGAFDHDPAWSPDGQGLPRLPPGHPLALSELQIAEADFTGRNRG
jgi:dipeptidyl aminopeptidase/acylaminoacyl peptidase